MKYGVPVGVCCRVLSHPSRGAWIEIAENVTDEGGNFCRTPHGVRGLKSLLREVVAVKASVAPLTGCVD